MGAGAGKPQNPAKVDLECDPTESGIFVNRNSANKTSNEFTVPTNTLVSAQRINFKTKTRIRIKCKGGCVLRIGLTNINPSENENILEGSVFEKEEGFSSDGQEAVRMLHNVGYYFRYGPEGGEIEYDKDGDAEELWLYVIYVYGTPDVKAELLEKSGNNKMITLCSAKSDTTSHATIVPNTARCRISQPVVNGDVYHCYWDMKLRTENIAGKPPCHGFMRIKLVSRTTDEGVHCKENIVWERSSAVLEYPFSSVIAFRLSLHEKQVSHNLFVESVGNTKKDVFTAEGTLDPSTLYFVIEFGSGEIQVTHGKRLIIAQELGSTIMISDYDFDDDEATSEEAITEIKSKIDYTPRRLQYGSNPYCFVLEFNEKLTDLDVKNIESNLNCKAQRIQDTKSVQINLKGAENVSEKDVKYDLGNQFTRTKAGGGSIKRIEAEKDILGCWVIDFEKNEIARNVWMKGNYNLTIGDNRVKALVLPVYKGFGLSVNGGEKPITDQTPLVVDVNKNKLRFIKLRKSEKKSFEDALNETIKVEVYWEPLAEQDEDDEFANIDEHISDEEASITFKYSGSKLDWKKSANWKEITRKVVTNYFKTAIHQVTLHHEVDVTGKLDVLKRQFEFEYEVDVDNKRILLYGSNKNTLKVVAENAGRKVVIQENISKSIENILPEYLALDAEGILDKVKFDHRNTSFKVNHETGSITLKGPKEEVDNSHRCILDLALKTVSAKLKIREEHLQFLLKGGLEMLKEQFRKQKLNYHFTVSEKEKNISVIIYIGNEGVEKKEKKMLEVIENFIKICEISLGKDHLATDWKHCIKEICKKASGPLAIFESANNKTITIVGKEETVKAAKAGIEHYVQCHKLGSDTIRVPVEIAMYLDEFKDNDIRNDIECVKDSDGLYTGKLSLTSSPDNLSRLQKVVEKDVKEIKQHWFIMKEKWIASIIQDLEDLKTLSHNEQFLMDVFIGHSLAAHGITGLTVFSKTGTIIQVRQRDISFETTATIVHSTNGNLKTFSKGAGKCLQDIGGTEIKDELFRIIEERKSKIGDTLTESMEEKAFQSQPDSETEHEKNEPSKSGFTHGDLIITDAGQLRCLKVIHVFPPRWIDGNKSGEEIKTLVCKILQTCQDMKLDSISIPAIGCGTGKFPYDKATSHIVEAVANFIENAKNTVIKEIVLCDTSETAVKKFTEALRNRKGSSWDFFEHGIPIKVEDFMSSSIRKAESKVAVRPSVGEPERPKSGVRWGRRNAPMVQREKTQSSYKNNTDLNDLFQDGLPYCIPISEKLTLHVVKSDLAKQKVDAIVNTTAEFPNLTGAVSKAILKAGGNTILQECQTLGTISVGEIKCSEAGRLNCKEIIHVKIPMRWHSQEGEKFVGDLVSTCLAKANANGHSSIAFPTIGTGNSGFPADKVANAMVKSICEAGTENSSLTDVYIVVYLLEDGICKIFEDVIPHCFNSVKKHSTGMTISKKGANKQPKYKTVRYVPPPSFDKHSKIDDVVVFKIVSKTSGEEIQKKIQEIVKRQIKQEQLNFQQLTSENTLTEVEERSLKILGMKYGVDVKIDYKSKLVKIMGLSKRVQDCQFEAMDLLRDTFPRLRLKTKKIKTIAETVQWYYGDSDGNSHRVDDLENYEIHMKYLDGKDFTYDNQSEKKTYKVLINDMMEHPIDDPKKKRRLYLRTKIDENIPLPENWSIALDDSKKLDQIKLKESDAEFNDVKDKFIKGGCKPKRFESISRLENKFLWQQYQTKKKQIEAQNPSINNERLLWHGTDLDTVPKIVKYGFDRSFTTTCAYGKGAYFAVQSLYSDQSRYAKPDVNGVKRMFLNRVLVGVHCLGNQNMEVLPVRQGVVYNNFPVHYDSAADSNGNSPGIFVIFHDTQAYPEYLIEYS